MSKSVVVKNVSKKYKLYNSNSERLLDILLPKSYGEDFYALRNVSFEAEKGDVIGFVGINGSGKSTMLNILAQIIPETSGVVEVQGKTALIAVASGMNNELTGRENIEMKLLMLGFSKKEIKELEPEIIEFSELGKFIDQPVKSYSSGMRSRLGFAISVNIDPDILIIDEALSVGDSAFAEKSFEKMKEFKERGKTMFFVSHSMTQMKRFCEKVIWLEFGQLKMYDTVDKVIPAYQKFFKDYKEMSKAEQKKFREDALNRQSQPELILN
ncbi:teichoic acids export ABC transporter ATP-binding subunit TagH [Mesobacillus foraminis]|uniref:teichoic acids export ABC transporter ATP-binding subunit TagH n=1 Tax=Mesobacillus foraminis TaxID=279826 RepID=UPI000EF54EE2|nr:teichoic acids export ABC transporter ATP-binding subunit TagH [Mesobacillus foraminis]